VVKGIRGVFYVLRTQNTPTYPVRHGDSQRPFKKLYQKGYRPFFMVMMFLYPTGNLLLKNWLISFPTFGQSLTDMLSIMLIFSTSEKRC
jgi:hypothetical protein